MTPRFTGVGRVAAICALGAALVVCWILADVRPGALFDAQGLRGLSLFVRSLFPPAHSPEFLRLVLAAMLRTLWIAVAGTALSVLGGLPLAVLATPLLWRRGPLVAAERPGASRALLAAASLAARGLLRFLRAVPDLVWALVFVVALGLGPLPGALALGVSYAGVVGRVYADLFEAVPPGPVEALHATGASRLQILAVAIWPQAAPTVAAYTLYSFECCVRAASVLGFVGAGGIGQEINISLRMYEYGEVSTLLCALLALVAGTDAFSRFLRRRWHPGAGGGRVLRAPVSVIDSARERGLPRVLRWAAAAIVVAGASLWVARLPQTPSAVFARTVRFAAQLLPPDLSPGFLLSLAVPLSQTLAISVMGTLLGVALGAAFALPATSTLVLGRPRAAGRRSALLTALRLSLYSFARLTLGLLRSIPELIWVLLCILAVGLGPFAGTLALGLHTAGVLGKLYAEALEEVPPAPLEEVRATGASALQSLVWAIWPQARETVLSYTLLRWETNLRISTVVGLVGGGGLGLAMYNDVQLGFYQQVMTLILLVYLLVAVTDGLADRLRRPRTVDDALPPAGAVEPLAA